MFARYLMAAAVCLFAGQTAHAAYHEYYEGTGYCGAMRLEQFTSDLALHDTWTAEMQAAAAAARTEAEAGWATYQAAVIAYWRASQGQTKELIDYRRQGGGRAPTVWDLRNDTLDKSDRLRPLFQALEGKKLITLPKPRVMDVDSAIANAARIMNSFLPSASALTANPLGLIEDTAEDPWMRGPHTPGVPLDIATLLARAAYLQALHQIAEAAQTQIYELLPTYECLSYLSQQAMLVYDVLSGAGLTRAQAFWNFHIAITDLGPVSQVLNFILIVPNPATQAPLLRDIADTYDAGAETVRLVPLIRVGLEASLAHVEGVPGTEVGQASYDASILPEAFDAFAAIAPDVAAFRTLFNDGAAAMEALAAAAPSMDDDTVVEQYYQIVGAHFQQFRQGYELLEQVSQYMPRHERDILEIIALFPSPFHSPIVDPMYPLEDQISAAIWHTRTAHLAMQAVLAN
ncbi:MAG: hypothetical protein QNJ16_07130 [Rhodobacter sp.]|nr:hypothetical protein [Rhodobacter sp.]